MLRTMLALAMVSAAAGARRNPWKSGAAPPPVKSFNPVRLALHARTTSCARERGCRETAPAARHRCFPPPSPPPTQLRYVGRWYQMYDDLTAVYETRYCVTA